MQFVDTNILLYAISVDPDEQDKAASASRVLSSRELAVSTQVLGEFYVQATRPSRPDPLSHDQAAALVESFTRFQVQPVTAQVVRAALSLRSRYQLSYWDAVIAAAARACGCDTLVTEDLQDGQDLDGVRIWNPFHS